MKTKNRTTLIAAAALSIGLLAAAGAHAALVSVLGGQAINDTDLNVTWLADANYAKTSGYDADGLMTWTQAQSWIVSLNAENGGGGHLGYNNWRLPTTGPVNGVSMNYNFSYNGSTDYGYNVSAPGTAYAGSKGSEMAYLFYNELGNKGYCDPATSTTGSCSGPQAGWGLSNSGLFSNLQSIGVYWSGTEYAPSTSFAWGFVFYDGYQVVNNKTNNNFYALAVRSGDVAAVPEADTWALLLAGLGLVGAMARRRKQAEI
jgi:MYXO-CTERM domain-containing protein